MWFETLQQLVTQRRSDILLVFQIGGMKRALEYRPESINRFFGDRGEWYGKYRSAGRRGVTRALFDYYKERLPSVGYLGNLSPNEAIVRMTNNVPLYYLVLASKSRRAVEFWRECIRRTATGERRLPGL